MATDAAGRTTVAWNTSRTVRRSIGVVTLSGGIRVAPVDVRGRVGRVRAVTRRSGVQPQLAALPGGRFALAWDDRADVVVALGRHGGAVAEPLLLEAGSVALDGPVVAAGADGTVAVVWTRGSSIRVAVGSASTGRFGRPAEVARGRLDVRGRSVVVAPDGRISIAFQSTTPEPGGDFRGAPALVTGRRGAFAAPVLAAGDGLDPYGAPILAAGPAGELAVAWTKAVGASDEIGPFAPGPPAVTVGTSTGALTPSAVVPLANPKAGFGSAVAFARPGLGLLLWHERRDLARGTPRDQAAPVYAASFERDGRLGPARPVVTASVRGIELERLADGRVLAIFGGDPLRAALADSAGTFRPLATARFGPRPALATGGRHAAVAVVTPVGSDFTGTLRVSVRAF